jgi:Fe-S-cluster-containing dehydrogenase component
MSKYCITQDKNRCIACLSCEIFCEKNKGIPEENRVRLCQIVVVDKRKASNLPRDAYIYMGCFHCEKPYCVAACPTGAMQKRESDGIVFIDSEKCVGCKACMVACPWGAVQWNPLTAKVLKCDLCMDRLDKGLKPVCATICTTGCLTLSDMQAGENVM